MGGRWGGTRSGDRGYGGGASYGGSYGGGTYGGYSGGSYGGGYTSYSSGGDRHSDRRRRGPTVQLRGIPYRATEREIADWLSEAADPVEVIINIGRDGRPAGSADAVFETSRDARRVVQELHKKDMGSRYIECFYDGED